VTADAPTVRRLVITGRVQGVGYRVTFADQARVRNLSGWVRNCGDGSVEAIVSGAAADVDAIISWARRGPPAAHVSGVRVDAASGVFAGFDIASSTR
jgi:acylphosphatase